MRYVIIRDDDTNALTPVECLERLYRPFLERGLPVNLATIPNVRTEIRYGEGILEGFLVMRNGVTEKFVPLGQNQKLVRYLRGNPGYHIVQHGFSHEFINGDCEFEQHDRQDIVRRIEQGGAILEEAGLGRPKAFVAPYDRFTRTSAWEIGKRFRLISANWYEWRRLPMAWWPAYGLKWALGRPHWRAGRNILLSHPGCHLSYHRPYDVMLEKIQESIRARALTVLVTHWWEFYREGQPDDRFIDVLHETAEFLSKAPDVRVVTFDDVANGEVPLV